MEGQASDNIQVMPFMSTVVWAIIGALLVFFAGRYYWRQARQIYGQGRGAVDVSEWTPVDLGVALFLFSFLLWMSLWAFLSADEAVPLNWEDLRGDLIFKLVSFLLLWCFLLVRGVSPGGRFGLGAAAPPLSVMAKWVVVLLGLGYPLIVAADWLGKIPFLLQGGGEIPLQQSVAFFVETDSLAQQLGLVVYAVVVAPIWEEFFFRGFIYGAMKRYFGGWGAWVACGTLFALVHVYWPALLPLFVLALIFTVAYEVSGTLWVPMAMHAIFNGVTLMALLFLPEAGAAS